MDSLQSAIAEIERRAESVDYGEIVLRISKHGGAVRFIEITESVKIKPEAEA